MTSYHMIVKWAIEAKQLLDEGNVAGVSTNLRMIVDQARDEILYLDSEKVFDSIGEQASRIWDKN